MADLTILRVVDEDGVRAWQAIDAATHEADHLGLPADPVEEVLPLLSGEAAGDRVELWLGVDGGVPVATADVRFPRHDNATAATVDVRVIPQHRRRGHGRAMLEHVLDRTRSAGRHRVFLEAAEPLGAEAGQPAAPGAAFARAAGARPVLAEVRRLLQFDDLPPDRLAGLRAEAERHAGAYTVLQWVDRAPADVLEDVAALMGRMTTDAPMEDMEWEPEVWTAARYRANEDNMIARARQRFASAARHDASGRVVGYTDLGVSRIRPDVAYQWDTIVTPEHRGHRLGMLLKAANLALLRDTVAGVRQVNTWNAAVNDHMVAINDALGFRPVERWVEWQLDLT